MSKLEFQSLNKLLALFFNCIVLLQSYIWMNELETAPVYTSCVSTLFFVCVSLTVLEGASCASGYSSHLSFVG